MKLRFAALFFIVLIIGLGELPVGLGFLPYYNTHVLYGHGNMILPIGILIVVGVPCSIVSLSALMIFGKRSTWIVRPLSLVAFFSLSALVLVVLGRWAAIGKIGFAPSSFLATQFIPLIISQAYFYKRLGKNE